jgi:DNA-binding NarL/FixJ family response regulator
MNHESFLDHEAFVANVQLPLKPILATLGVEVQTGAGDRDASGHRAVAALTSKATLSIALIESRAFVGECIHRSLHAALSLPLELFSTLAELESGFSKSFALFLLSLADFSQEECTNALTRLGALAPGVPIVVLSSGANHIDFARTAISYGAKGYIPSTTNFEIVVEAVRFILAGGTYVPIDHLFGQGTFSPLTTKPMSPPMVLTEREMSVVQAIQEGKSNKIIAYKLCICEGTVKVHLRNIMKKLNAKNRTDVAVKMQASVAPSSRLSSKGVLG